MRVGFIILFVFIVSVQLVAQAPLGFNYQGIARQADGTPISKQSIGIKVSIIDGPQGSVQFTEIHLLETNDFGLFTAIVGQGTGGNTLNSVDWSIGNLWLQIELDPDNSGSYILMGSQQLMSVPYALFAQQSGEGLTPGYGIDINNGTISNVLPDRPISITGATDIEVAGTYPNFTISSTVTADGDGDSTNEFQTISKTGNEVMLSDSGGSFIDEVDDADNDIANEIQDLQLVGNILTITKNGASTDIDLAPYFDNTDTQLSEIEVDAFTDNNGYLTSEVDGNITNEIQDLQLVGDNLEITKNGSATTIDLSGYLDNTDTQLTEAEVDAFTNNNGHLTSEVDGSITNEIQDLQLVGDNLTITNNGTATTIDLSGYLDNTDNQNLSLSIAGTNRTIGITSGAGVVVDVADNDNSISNETITATSFEANNTIRVTEGGVDNDLPIGTLNADLDANSNKIVNLADPVDAQDAVTMSFLESESAKDFAISVPISTNLSGVAADIALDLSSATLDKGGLILGSVITITDPGVYSVSVQGVSNLGTGSNIEIRINGVGTQILKGLNHYLGTYLFDLVQNDQIEMVVSYGGTPETLTLQVAVFKI
jgi:hypothetical protein